ncbi:glycolate oxidase subunit GlcE [Ottowia sp.]|uniref:glycolate oxidase subunit GlcE n=1 Tax=Ottowia sp. TaxID=1898956 RepID=UPI003A890F6A
MDTALESLVEKIRQAAARARPLRICGGGTKDFYGQQLHGELLDVRPFKGVVSYEPSELVVTARAGTRVHELEALLAESGQCLPFEPPRFGVAGTVGGMVAAGLSGPARASVGALRDYVLGVQLINGRGELLTFGGQVMKNVAGYDVSRLMAGSMGTLGVIAEVSLKVLPRPMAEATLVFEMSETSARQQLNRWCGQALPINASAWSDGQLLLRLRGAQAAVGSARQWLGGQWLEGERAARHWGALRDQALPFFRLALGEALWRVSVPDTAPPLNLGPTLLEWHGAQRWIKLTPQDAPRVRDAAARARGHATLFRGGDGRVPVFTPLAQPLARIHRALKAEFDPAGILGQGRMGA